MCEKSKPFRTSAGKARKAFAVFNQASDFSNSILAKRSFPGKIRIPNLPGSSIG